MHGPPCAPRTPVGSLALRIRSSDKLKILSLSASSLTGVFTLLNTPARELSSLYLPLHLHLLVFILLSVSQHPPDPSSSVCTFSLTLHLLHSPFIFQPCCVPCFSPLFSHCILFIHLFTPYRPFSSPLFHLVTPFVSSYCFSHVFFSFPFPP